MVNYFYEKNNFVHKQGLPMRRIDIMDMRTHENRNKSTAHAVKMDYNDVKKYVNEHKDELMQRGKRHEIMVLTEFGWRSNEMVGKGYMWSDFDSLFYDPSKNYDDYTVDDMDIFAISIIEW